MLVLSLHPSFREVYLEFTIIADFVSKNQSCSHSVVLFMSWTGLWRKDERENAGHEMEEEFQIDYD